jgi:3-oxoacyl-[acyl-carrier protein] reductase
VAAIRAAGRRAIAVQADVSRSADVDRLFAETGRTLGTPNVLVNNAGVFAFEPLEDVTEERFHWQYNTNVLGTLFTIQHALRYFPASGGSIINISSVASTNPVPTSAVYSSTKAAVDAITIALSRELGARNIRVNAVAPGHTETEGTHRIGLVGSAAADRFASETPIGGRFGLPSDVAPVVSFLASDEAAWVSGERISASGGWR